MPSGPALMRCLAGLGPECGAGAKENGVRGSVGVYRIDVLDGAWWSPRLAAGSAVTSRAGVRLARVPCVAHVVRRYLTAVRARAGCPESGRAWRGLLGGAWHLLLDTASHGRPPLCPFTLTMFG